MTNYAADPVIARYQAMKKYDPYAPKPETDPVIKGALVARASEVEKRALNIPDQSYSRELMRVAKRLADASDVHQSLLDRQELRHKLQTCNLGGAEGIAQHEEILRQIDQLHLGYGTTPEEGKALLDAIDKVVSGGWIHPSDPNYRAANLIGGRIMARIQTGRL